MTKRTFTRTLQKNHWGKSCRRKWLRWKNYKKPKGSVHFFFFFTFLRSNVLLKFINRALSNAEDERDNIKELNDKLNEQILQLADKFEKESEELLSCKKKLEEVEVLQQRVEQETQLRQDAIREAQEKETVLLAQVQQKVI